jgi:hypothetical protein
MSKLQLMVVHNQLVGPTGHAYTESLGWRRLCAERGYGLSLYGSRWTDPGVAAETGAIPLFGCSEEERGRLLDEEAQQTGAPADVAALQAFMISSFEIASGCERAWAALPQPPDLLVFPWTTAAVIDGLADWLGKLPAAERPRLALNVVHPEPTWTIDPATLAVGGDFSAFRLACHRLEAVTEPSRLAMTAVAPRLASLVGELAGLDCRPAPLHKFYPSPAALDSLRPTERGGPPVISALGSDRPLEKGWGLLPQVMGRVCGATAAAFFIQVQDRPRGERFAEVLRELGRPVNVTIHPGPLTTDDYFRRVLASDLVLLPYLDPAYAYMPSGIFADAVVCGAPVVAPARTWVADRLAEGWGAGEIFETPTPEAIAAAVTRALSRLDALRTDAAGQGEAWRRAHSLEAHVDHILGRLGLTG